MLKILTSVSQPQVFDIHLENTAPNKVGFGYPWINSVRVNAISLGFSKTEAPVL